MSSFKFKDLFVTVRLANEPIQFSNYCHPCNNSFFTGSPIYNGPVHTTLDCSAGCWLPPPILNPTIPVEGFRFGFGAVQQYSSLKEYLKVALATEEAREKALDESQKPQTVGEVEELEEKLKGALHELSVRKTELQQKK